VRSGFNLLRDYPYCILFKLLGQLFLLGLVIIVESLLKIEVCENLVSEFFVLKNYLGRFEVILQDAYITLVPLLDDFVDRQLALDVLLVLGHLSFKLFNLCSQLIDHSIILAPESPYLLSMLQVKPLDLLIRSFKAFSDCS